MSSAVHGSCLCEGIKIDVKGEPLRAFICHCFQCKKAAGGPYQTNVIFNSSDLEINDSQGHLKTYRVTDTDSGKVNIRLFCGNCGCTIAIRKEYDNGARTLIKSGILNGG